MLPPAVQQFLSFSSESLYQLIDKEKEEQDLNEPIYIRFEEEWGTGNPLYEWYSERSDRTIIGVWKCKERKIPYFHEYIMIQLDNEECYRIDRRPHEGADPMDYAKNKGVTASDTIKRIPTFEHGSHCSNRLLYADLHSPVQLGLLLRILHAIHKHPKANVYTLRRYNCHFFAQVIEFFIIRSVTNCHNKGMNDIKFPFSGDYWRKVALAPEVVNPTNEYFAPIHRANGAAPRYRFRSLLFKKKLARREEKHLECPSEDSERSDISSIQNFRQLNPHALSRPSNLRDPGLRNGRPKISGQFLMHVRPDS
ncbi:hypothetical protein FRC11_010786 [Ceratobasidium sp. 423]|nr:hypothetical protein FRC11_010786 [Ceratobasidium sp. 423]